MAKACEVHDIADIPVAANIHIMLCEDVNCGRLHVVLTNEDGKPIATATPDRSEDLIDLLVQAKNLLAQMEQPR